MCLLGPYQQAIEEDDGVERAGKCVFGSGKVDLSDSDDDEDSDDDDDMHRLQIRTDDLDKKAAAVHAIGVFARVCKAKFQPYLDQSVEHVMDMLAFFHDRCALGSGARMHW